MEDIVKTNPNSNSFSEKLQTTIKNCGLKEINYEIDQEISVKYLINKIHNKKPQQMQIKTFTF